MTDAPAVQPPEGARPRSAVATGAEVIERRSGGGRRATVLGRARDLAARRPWLLVAAICGLALLARVIYVLTLGPAIAWYDGEHYSRLAAGQVQTGRYDNERGHPSAFWPPGYPFLLAAVYRFFGVNVTAVRLAQCLIGAAGVGMVQRIARRVVDPASTWLAALAAALYPLFIYSAGAFFPVTLLIALMAGVVLFVLLALERRSAVAALTAGALAGWEGLTNGSTLLALLLVAPWMAWAIAPVPGAAPGDDGGWGGAAPRAGRRGGVGLALLYLLPLTLIVGGWTLRNQLVLGRPVIVSCNAGYNVWLGNYPGVQASTGNRMDQPGMNEEAARIWSQTGGEAVRDRAFSRRALAYIRADLPRFLRLSLQKGLGLWALYAEPMTENRPRMRLEKLASILSYGVLLPFALAWLFLTLRRNRISALILILFLSFTLVHAVSLSKVRYRLPLDSFVIIYGVGGAIALLRTLARRAARSRPAGAPAANAG